MRILTDRESNPKRDREYFFEKDGNIILSAEIREYEDEIWFNFEKQNANSFRADLMELPEIDLILGIYNADLQFIYKVISSTETEEGRDAIWEIVEHMHLDNENELLSEDKLKNALEIKKFLMEKFSNHIDISDDKFKEGEKAYDWSLEFVENEIDFEETDNSEDTIVESEQENNDESDDDEYLKREKERLGDFEPWF